MTPSISFGSPIDGKPFVLVVPTDHEDAVVYLTPEALRVLVASGDAALVEHRQATCGHEVVNVSVVETDRGRPVGRCSLCDAEVVFDGGDWAPVSVVPVGEGT